MRYNDLLKLQAEAEASQTKLNYDIAIEKYQRLIKEIDEILKPNVAITGEKIDLSELKKLKHKAEQAITECKQKATKVQVKPIEQEKKNKKSTDLIHISNMLIAVDLILNCDPTQIKTEIIDAFVKLGESAELIAWDEDDENCIRNKYGYINRHKKADAKLNECGIDFEQIAYLKQIFSKEYDLYINLFKNGFSDICKDLKALQAKLHFIKDGKNKGKFPQEKILYLTLITAYYNDKNRLNQLITELKEEDFKNLNLKSDIIDRYYFARIIVILGENVKNLSRFLRTDKDIDSLLHAIAKLRDLIKGKPHVVSAGKEILLTLKNHMELNHITLLSFFQELLDFYYVDETKSCWQMFLDLEKIISDNVKHKVLKIVNVDELNRTTRDVLNHKSNPTQKSSLQEKTVKENKKSKPIENPREKLIEYLVFISQKSAFLKENSKNQKKIKVIEPELAKLKEEYQNLRNTFSKELQLEFPSLDSNSDIEKILKDLSIDKQKILQGKKNKVLVEKESKVELDIKAKTDNYWNELSKKLSDIIRESNFQKELHLKGNTKKTNYALAQSMGFLGQDIKQVWQSDKSVEYFEKICSTEWKNSMLTSLRTRHKVIMHGDMLQDNELLTKVSQQEIIPWIEDSESILTIHNLSELLKNEQLMSKDSGQLFKEKILLRAMLLNKLGLAHVRLQQYYEAAPHFSAAIELLNNILNQGHLFYFLQQFPDNVEDYQGAFIYVEKEIFYISNTFDIEAYVIKETKKNAKFLKGLCEQIENSEEKQIILQKELWDRFRACIPAFRDPTLLIQMSIMDNLAEVYRYKFDGDNLVIIKKRILENTRNIFLFQEDNTALAKAYNELGCSYFYTKMDDEDKINKGLKCFESADKIKTDVMIISNLAEILAIKSKFKEAIERYKEALKLALNNDIMAEFRIRCALADIYRKISALEMATCELECANKLLDSHAGIFKVRLGAQYTVKKIELAKAMADNFSDMCEYDKARDSYEMSLKLFNNELSIEFKTQTKKLILIGLADVSRGLGDYNKSEIYLRELALEDISSNNTEYFLIHNDLGLTYFLQNKLKEAEQHFDMAVTAAEKNLENCKSLLAAIYNNLASLTLAKNDLLNSEKWIDKAFNLINEIYADTPSMELVKNYERQISLHFKKMDFRRALELVLIAINTSKKIFPSLIHEYFFTLCSSGATCYQQLNEVKNELNFWEEAFDFLSLLAKKTKNLDPKLETLLKHSCKILLNKNSKPEVRIKLVAKAISLYEKYLPTDNSIHPILFSTAKFCNMFGELSDANIYIRRAIIKSNDPSCNVVYCNLFTEIERNQNHKIRSIYRQPGISAFLLSTKKENRMDFEKDAKYFYEVGKYDEALCIYLKLMLSQPNQMDVTSGCNIGHCYYRFNNYLQAVYYYSKVIDHDHQHTSAHEWRAKAYRKLAEQSIETKDEYLQKALLDEGKVVIKCTKP